jgi:purine-binding chemotaxis protein CheW
MMTHKTAAGAPGARGEAHAQYLTFLLGEEIYAMDLRAAREIIQHGPMTALPMMPGFVRGVINLRGAALPVIDLQVRFGRAPARVSDKSCIVVFDAERGGRRALGLLVDAVRAVIEIAADQIEPPPDFGNALRREFLQGIGKVDDRFVIILDPDTVLDVSELDQVCAPAAAAPVACASDA